MEPIIEVRQSAQHPDLPLADMRALLAAAVVKARAQEPPGDGGSLSLGLEKTLGAGMRDGGWKLQAEFERDRRIWADGPQVVVYAYKEDERVRGSTPPS